MTKMNDKNEAMAYHALAVNLHASYESLKRTRAKYGSWASAWAALKTPDMKEAKASWDELAAYGIRLVLANDLEFPKLLTEIPWPPFGLYLRGAPLDEALIVAIVGTRRATPTGKAIAKRFAESLARAGLTVVSGLALGIDAAAHNGALQANGRTIAVLGNGLNHIYPKENERLGEEIIATGGTLISEYPPGTPSLPKNFIERNRIIAGLSRGIIVIEAPEKSGALATARFALEQNREIFVIPGSIEREEYAGSHELIKAGANLVTSPEDVLGYFDIAFDTASRSHKLSPSVLHSLDKIELAMVTILQSHAEALSIDAVAEEANLEIPAASQALSFLIVKGLIKEQNGTYSIA
jgi:DNA processing protein